MSALDFCLDNCSALAGSVIDAARAELAASRTLVPRLLAALELAIEQRDGWQITAVVMTTKDSDDAETLRARANAAILAALRGES
jgi:hypothetical protein